jgi:hypothetical protein
MPAAIIDAIIIADIFFIAVKKIVPRRHGAHEEDALLGYRER